MMIILSIRCHLSFFNIDSLLICLNSSVERLFEPPEVHTGRLMLGAAVGFVCHIAIAYGVANKAFAHVSGASKSSWLQEHFADMSRK